MMAILRHYFELAKAGSLDGVVVLVVAEQEGGAYRATVSGTDNLAERVGRLRLIKALDLLERELVDEATETEP
jgi:hypothetical protein